LGGVDDATDLGFDADAMSRGSLRFRLPAQGLSVPARAFLFGASAILVPIILFLALKRPFPSDRTPEGAYLRIAQAVGHDDPKGCFPYLETEAQWANYTLRDMRRKASAFVAASYPEPQRTAVLAEYKQFAEAPDGSDVFVMLYRERRWSHRLRKDLSGVARVELDEAGERATVVTVRGTRWPFRKRENGIWGITIFTAEIVAEAEKASRDEDVVESAAADYDRLKAAAP
jgi:hypothetical protein